MKRIINVFMMLLEKTIDTQKKLICIKSLPNFSDEVYWLSDYAKKNHFKLVILFDGVVDIPNWGRAEHIRCVRYKSIQGVYFFIKAHYVIYTHGIYSIFGKKSRGITLNIWHGMPLKNIGVYRNVSADELPKFDYILADREEFVPVMAKAFSVETNSVIISPSPRMDSLSYDISIEKSFRNTYNRENIAIIWLPTFRTSYTGNDGDFLQLPFSDDEQLSAISSILEKHDALCYVKPHPLSYDDFSKIAKYENIKLLENDKEMSLYSRIRKSDIVITDFSSIMFDLDHIGKEVLLYTPDLMEYKQSVGLIDSVLEGVEAKIIVDFIYFLDSLEEKIIKLNDSSNNRKAPSLSRGYWTSQMFQKLYKNMGTI